MKISDRTMKIIMVGSLCWIAAVIVIWLVGNQLFVGSAADVALILQFLLTVIPMILGIVSLFKLAAAHGFSTISGKIWSLLGCGLACWLAGDTTYGILQITGQSRFPSLADVFYIASYVPWAIGLVVQMAMLKIKLHQREMVRSIIIIILCGASIGIYVIIPTVVKMALSGASALAQFVGALYPAFDIVLLTCVIVIFAKLYHGKLNTAWIFILFGIGVNTLGDCLYWVSYSQGDVYLFNLYNMVFIVSYVLIFVGSLKLINIMMTTFEKPKDSNA